MKESSKKTFMRSTWAGNVDKYWRWKTGKECRCQESGGERRREKLKLG